MPEDLTGKYADLIGAETAEEVYRKVREWTSDLSEKEHLVRSIILEIHATVETQLKKTLHNVLSPLIVSWGNRDEYERHRKKLLNTINRMSFARVYELLR